MKKIILFGFVEDETVERGFIYWYFNELHHYYEEKFVSTKGHWPEPYNSYMNNDRGRYFTCNVGDALKSLALNVSIYKKYTEK